MTRSGLVPGIQSQLDQGAEVPGRVDEVPQFLGARRAGPFEFRLERDAFGLNIEFKLAWIGGGRFDELTGSEQPTGSMGAPQVFERPFLLRGIEGEMSTEVGNAVRERNKLQRAAIEVGVQPPFHFAVRSGRPMEVAAGIDLAAQIEVGERAMETGLGFCRRHQYVIDRQVLDFDEVIALGFGPDIEDGAHKSRRPFARPAAKIEQQRSVFLDGRAVDFGDWKGEFLVRCCAMLEDECPTNRLPFRRPQPAQSRQPRRGGPQGGPGRKTSDHARVGRPPSGDRGPDPGP